MITREYSVSAIKVNQNGGVQYRHFIMTTKTLFKKSASDICKDFYKFLDYDNEYVIISLSRL